MNRLYKIAMGAGLCLCIAGIAEAQVSVGGSMGTGGASMGFGGPEEVKQAQDTVFAKTFATLFAGIQFTAPQQDSLNELKAAEADEHQALEKRLRQETIRDSAEHVETQKNRTKWMDAAVALLTPKQKSIYKKNVAAQTKKQGQGASHTRKRSDR